MHNAMSLEDTSFADRPGCGFVLAAAHSSSAQQLRLTPYKAGGTYGVGEKVAGRHLSAGLCSDWRLHLHSSRKTIRNVIKTGNLDLTTGRANIEVTLDEPAMVYVRISTPGGSGSGPAEACGRRGL